MLFAYEVNGDIKRDKYDKLYLDYERSGVKVIICKLDNTYKLQKLNDNRFFIYREGKDITANDLEILLDMGLLLDEFIPTEYHEEMGAHLRKEREVGYDF